MLFQEVYQAIGKARYSLLLFKRLAVIQYVFTHFSNLIIYHTYSPHDRILYSVGYRKLLSGYPASLHLLKRPLLALLH